MDLYPFFPPLVKVIRPRLQGSMMLRVTTIEIVKLSHWNPARNMKSVLVDIKSFLQDWARLDFRSERNDRSRYPDGAYIDIEHHLLRLALVSSIAFTNFMQHDFTKKMHDFLGERSPPESQQKIRHQCSSASHLTTKCYGGGIWRKFILIIYFRCNNLGRSRNG